MKLNREAVRDASFDLAVKFLSGRMGRELHEKLIRDALKNFEELGSHESDVAYKGPILVTTAYALPRSAERHLKLLIQKKFGKKLTMEITAEPGLRAGFSVTWGGYVFDGTLRGALAAYAENRG